MCGRYSLTVDQEELALALEVDRLSLEHRPRYNIAPGQEAPVLVRDHEGLKLGPLRWGMAAPGTNDPRVGRRLVNARSETAHRLPAFRASYHRRRCVVPADGFYEWAREGSGRRPFWIHRPDGSVFGMAGLWRRWDPPGGGDPEYGFVILTRPAVGELLAIHDRMPVLLTGDDLGRWLEPDEEGGVSAPLSRSPPPMVHRPVSTWVNSPAHDDPRCIEAVPAPGTGPAPGR